MKHLLAAEGGFGRRGTAAVLAGEWVTGCLPRAARTTAARASGYRAPGRAGRPGPSGSIRSVRRPPRPRGRSWPWEALGHPGAKFIGIWGLAVTWLGFGVNPCRVWPAISAPARACNAARGGRGRSGSEPAAFPIARSTSWHCSGLVVGFNLPIGRGRRREGSRPGARPRGLLFALPVATSATNLPDKAPRKQ